MGRCDRVNRPDGLDLPAPNEANLEKMVKEFPIYGNAKVRLQSAAGIAGIFSQRTNQTQKAWAYSHHGPIRHRKPCGRARHGHCKIDR
eukprot:5937834-Pyramimonas_sp.AAC.1